MKLITLAALFSTVVGFANASYLPGFIFQDEDLGTVFSESTRLITNCGDANDILTIDYVTLNPDPPIKGQNLEIDFKGYLSETVPNGTVVELLVKYGVVKLLQKKFDFCDEIQKVDEICPIPEGDLTFHKQVELPKDIPPGKYTVHAEIITPEGKRVTCLNGQTIFPRTNPRA